MKAKRSLVVILIIAIWFTSIPQTAFAWKAKTHNYIANLILEEVQANKQGSTSKINIAPYGFYNVDPEFYTALTQYPSAFRAGAQGPDAYPDIYVGQSFIHPREGKSSGEWLQMMLEDALRMPQNDPKRYEIMAFLLGYMCHYAGDLFGHNYINGIAGGAYPDMLDLADKDKAEEALTVITRHLSSEAYIDSKIPNQYKTGEKVNLAAPKDFILASFVYNGHKNNGFSDHYSIKPSDSDYDPMDPEKFLPKHFQYIAELRYTLYQKSQYYRAYSNSKNAFDYVENTVIVNYLDVWIADIDAAMSAWIQVSENIAKGVVTSGDKNDLIVVKNELSNWFNRYGKYMTPVPDAIIKSLGAPESFAKFLKDQGGLEYLYDKYEEFVSEIEDMMLNYMIYDVAGLSEEDVQQMREAMSSPSLILGEDVLATMDEEMKNFGSSTALTADQQEFAPFYNSLVMTKLILIGPDGVNNLIQQATGTYINSDYQKSTGKNTIDNLQVRIKTKKNKTKWGIPTTNYGTDDDVYFGVTLQDGSTKELLFDKSGKNDFNSNNDDTYTFTLNAPLTPGEIRQIWIRKDNVVKDDWNPEFVEVSGYYGNMKVANVAKYTGLPEFNGNETWRSNLSFADSTYTTSLNTGMIDFMESLDGSLQWKNTNFALWKNESLRSNVFYKIFKDVEKYDDASYDMYAAYKTKQENITVDKASIKSLVNSSSLKITIKLNKVSQADGYEVVYATDSKFKAGKKKVSIISTSKSISKLTRGKTYYVKVRAYKLNSEGTRVYGSYSAVKKVKIVK